LLKMESDPDLPEAFYPPIHPDYDAEEEGDEWEGRSSTADLFYGMPVVPYETRFPNLDILPAAGEQLQAVELVRSEEVKSKIYEQIRLFLDDPDLQSLYDMVIIDTPPGKGAINRSVLRASTHVLLPVVPEEKPVQGLRSMIQFIRQENRYRETQLSILGVVPNKVDSRYRIHYTNIEQLRQDPLVRQYLTDFVISQRAAFPNVDAPQANPDTVWAFSGNDKAKEEALALCHFVEKQLYGT
ncbi:MAG: ParA family protein, partial [Gammaproteobacteria bacterium]